MNHSNKTSSRTSEKVSPVFAKTLLGSLIAMSVMNVQAQQVEEELIVTGQFQRNLQNAIDVKRNAATIVDGISADDIDALPALDMGEALQAVPGIQLNREGERRESSVNLRGLPSGFINTTANGQTIAAPKRGSQNDIFGAANPFGAYDPSIFNGINVIKTQDASMQEGGIAGSIDLRLPKALEQKNGGQLRIGARHEDLAGENDAEIGASGTFHIIEDVLAFTGSVGFSEQNWRRDSVRTNRYRELVDGNYSAGSTGLATLADWRAANGLEENAQITVPGEIRQASEINSGDRLSVAANIQWQAVEGLTLGASYISTDRSLDDNRLEQLELRDQRSGNFDVYGVTPLNAPRATGELSDDGAPIYLVSSVAIENSRYFYDNRQYNFFQESQALIFDAVWEADNWKLDGVVTISDAENIWDEILISPRADRGGSEADAVFYSGDSSPENWSLDITSFNEAIDFDQWVFNAAARELVTNSGAVPVQVPDGSGGLESQGDILLLTGTYEVVENDLNSFEMNFEHDLMETGITRFAAGVRLSQEDLDSNRQRVSGADVDPNGIFTNAGRSATLAQGTFFGGEIAGAADINDGWYSFDFDTVNNALISTIRPDSEFGELGMRGVESAVRLPNGYIRRANELGKGFDFESELDITALYAMADFEVGPAYGNFGVRYVGTDVSTVAPVYERTGSTITGGPSFVTVESDYADVLPSANVNFNLAEDVILRTAVNKTIVRPNLRAVSPQARVTVGSGGSEVDVTLPGSDLEPFDATSFDVSAEWYTGDSGLISIAAYYKKIDNYFVQDRVCQNVAGLGIGTVSGTSDACISSGTGEGDEGIAEGAEVEMNAWQNSDDTITVRGYEISLQQKLNFLPFPWNGFGGTINYTNVDQDSDVDEGEDDIQIFGISDESFNIIGFYELDNFGVRLAYNWRSDYDILASNTLFGEGVSTVKAVGRVDLAAYYNITEDLSISLKGYNLTESIYEEFETIEEQMRRADFEGRTFVLAASLKF